MSDWKPLFSIGELMRLDVYTRAFVQKHTDKLGFNNYAVGCCQLLNGESIEIHFVSLESLQILCAEMLPGAITVAGGPGEETAHIREQLERAAGLREIGRLH